MLNVLKLRQETTILQTGRFRMVAARDSEGVGGNRETIGRYLRLIKPAISIAGKQEGTSSQNQPFRLPALGAGRGSHCEALAEAIAVKVGGLECPAYFTRIWRRKRL